MRSQRLTSALALALTALLSALPARAQDAPRPRNPDLKIATFEVGDLVVTVPDYAAPQEGASVASGAAFYGGRGGGFGGGGGSFAMGAVPGGMEAGGNPMGTGQPFGSGPVTVPDLQRVITRVIFPDTWAVNGGDGQIEGIGASLVVLNTKEVHQLIDDMLNTLRHGSSARRSVAVDARWLLLNSDDLDRLNKRDDKGQPTVDRAALEELTRRPTSLRGLTNCFSGQGVYLISGTRRNVVRSYIPVVGALEQPEFNVAQAGEPRGSAFHFASGGARRFQLVADNNASGYSGRNVGYQPVVETPNFGVLLKIRPTLMHGEDAAVVDLTSTITFPGIDTGAGMDVPPPAGAPTPSIDRLAIDTQELATTLRVPLGQPVLVGGMSYIAPAGGASHEPADQPAAAAALSQETRQLYLVLEVR